MFVKNRFRNFAFLCFLTAIGLGPAKVFASSINILVVHLAVQQKSIKNRVNKKVGKALNFYAAEMDLKELKKSNKPIDFFKWKEGLAQLDRLKRKHDYNPKLDLMVKQKGSDVDKIQELLGQIEYVETELTKFVHSYGEYIGMDKWKEYAKGVNSYLDARKPLIEKLSKLEDLYGKKRVDVVCTQLISERFNIDFRTHKINIEAPNPAGRQLQAVWAGFLAAGGGGGYRDHDLDMPPDLADNIGKCLAGGAFGAVGGGWYGAASGCIGGIYVEDLSDFIAETVRELDAWWNEDKYTDSWEPPHVNPLPPREEK